MRRVILCLVMLPAFSMLAGASAWATTTIRLQQGVDGYSGCQDTYLDRNEPTTPMGGLGYLWQDAADTYCSGSGFSARAIIRFDLSIIPATAHLLSASLYLYGDSHRSYHGSAAPTDCFFTPITRPWSELEATWQQAAPGEPWNRTAGDPDDAPECFFDEPVQVTDIGVWARADVTRFVQSWVDGSLPNYGMVGVTWGQGQDERAHRFRSSQWPDPAFRPYLEITYEDPGVVSLPPSYIDPALTARADSHVYQHLEDQPLGIALSDMVELGARYVYTGYGVDLHDGEPVADQLLTYIPTAQDDEQIAAIVDRGLIPVFRLGITRNGGEPTVQDVYEVSRWYAARYAGEVHWFGYHGEFNNGWYYYGTTSCSPEHVTGRTVAAAQGVREVDPDNKMMLTQLGCMYPYEYIEECLPYGLAEATDQWGYGTGVGYCGHDRWYWPRDLHRWVILAAREAARVGHPISCQREGMINVDESAPTHRVQGKMVARKTVTDFVAGMVPSEWYKLYDHSPENFQIVADDLVTRYEAFYVLKNLNTYLDPGRWSGVYCGISMDQPYQRFAFRDDDGSLMMALWDGGGPVGEDLVAPMLTQVTCLDYGHVYADLVDPMSGAVTPISFVSASGRLTFSDIPVVDYPVLLRLRHGARGSITDAADGTPIAGAVLQAWQAGSLKAQGTTDLHGRYSIPLSPGSYSLVCECGDRPSQSRSVTVVPEASISADFAFTTLIKGDASGDGVISIFDVVKIANMAIGRGSWLDWQLWAADVNADGEINVFDVVICANKAVGLMSQRLAVRRAASAPAGPVTVTTTTTSTSTETTVAVELSDCAGLAGAQVELRYDPRKLSYAGMSKGALLTGKSSWAALDNDLGGTVKAIAYTASGEVLPGGKGAILTFSFNRAGKGAAKVELTSVKLADAEGSEIACQVGRTKGGK